MNKINQTHHGYGPNIGNDFNQYNINNTIFLGLSIESIITVAEDVLNLINERDIKKARAKIEVLDVIVNSDKESKFVVQMLKASCDFFEGKLYDVSHKDLIKIIQETKNGYLADLSLSFLLRSDLEKNDFESALERYQNAKVKGIYSNSIYYEKISDEDVLKKIYAEDRYNLHEIELSGILQGLFNYKQDEFISNVGDFLYAQFGTYNSRLLRAYSYALRLNDIIASKDYWCITYQEKSKIDFLISEIYELYKIQEVRDKRLFNLVIPLFVYLKGGDEILFKLCTDNVDIILEKNIDVALDLYPEYVVLPEDDISPSNKLRWAKKDEKKRLEAKDILKNKKHHNKDDFSFFIQIVKDAELKDWVANGGVINDEGNDLEVLFLKLILQLYKEKSNENDIELSLLVSQIVKYNNVGQNDASIITKISGKLISGKNFNDAVRLLEWYIGDIRDFWGSPLIDCISDTYFKAYHFKKLLNLYEAAAKDDISESFYHNLIMTYVYHSNLSKAEELSNVSLLQHPENLHLKLVYLSIQNQMGKNEVVKSELFRLDANIFSEPSFINVQFINLLLEYNPAFAEELVVNWFIENPIDNARLITEIHFNSILSIKNKNFTPSPETKECICGVIYDDSGEIFEKIIIKNPKDSNMNFIAMDSLIAKNLLDMKENEERELGFKKIKLIEKTPPFVSVIRLSSKIRNSINNGKDNFFIRKLSDDLDEMREEIKKLIPKKTNYHEITSLHKIPMNIRANHILRNDPYRAYLAAWQDKDFLKYSLRTQGIDGCKEILTDLVTIAYLSMTSLFDYFVLEEIDLYLSSASIEVIDEWIGKIENDQFKILSQMDGGGVAILDSGTIKNSWDNSYENLIKIRNHVKLYKPKIQDVNANFLLFMSNTNTLVASDFYFMSNSVYPVFTVDTALADWINISGGVQLVNAHSFIFEAVKRVDFKKRINGVVYFSLGCIPYAILLKDVHDLIDSEIRDKRKIISSLLNKLCGGIPLSIDGYVYLANIYNHYVIKVVTSAILPLNFHDNPYAAGLDTIFYFCCKNAINIHDGNNAEDKIAKLIFEIIKKWKKQSAFVEYTLELAHNFCRGHFLSIDIINLKIRKLINEI